MKKILTSAFLAMVFMALPQLLSAQRTKAQELMEYMGGLENVKKIAPVGEYIFRFDNNGQKTVSPVK